MALLIAPVTMADMPMDRVRFGRVLLRAMSPAGSASPKLAGCWSRLGGRIPGVGYLRGPR